MSSYPAVGIGILNWNGKKWLEKFLPFFSTVSYPNYKLYVIDNDSNDDSIEFLKNIYPQVTIIQTGGNRGFAGGYNRGFAQMPEEYLLMINSDVEVTTAFLEPLVEIMEADKTVAVCQSKILSWHKRDQFEHAGAAGGMMDVLGYSFCRGRIFDTAEKDEEQYKTSEIFWASGACCLIRRAAFMEVAGMYEYFFMHFEEIDMCWRMKARNYKVMYCDASTVYHVGGATLTYESASKTYYNFRNNLVMVVKNSPLLYLIWWLPVRFLLDMLAMVQYFLKGKGSLAWSVIRAYSSLFSWLWKTVHKKHIAGRSLTKFPVVVKRSIVWQYYIKKRSKYSEIINN